MKIETLKEILKNISSNKQFSVLTNLTNGSSEIFKTGTPLSKNFISNRDEIENYYVGEVALCQYAQSVKFDVVEVAC